ncbi:MAG TPA: hypothetical protein VG759_14445 [Candidatus Angelobacter sp.]|jgi:hypothetical protein|nr:hypothetical protein [Candidatus Angelobacter sp.]
MNSKVSSHFLFAQPSLISGMARLLDLGGVFDSYNISEKADSVALFADWRVVGQDIQDAILAFDDSTDFDSETPDAQYELFVSPAR